MASTTTELPIPLTGSKSKAGSDALEAEAIGLDVAVRIHGSQVAAVVLESTEHVEPFEEDTTTMIVFPRGAVVKLRARVRTGHAMVLTNLLTKQTALCRIIQVNTAPNIAHYVKLEFVQPTPGFWGIHFPSDPLPSARGAQTSEAVSTPVPPASAKSQKIAAELTAQTRPVPLPQVAPAAMPIAPAAQPPSRVEAQPVAAKPPVRETVSSTLPRDLPLSVPSTEYGNERLGQKEDLVPLASGSPSPSADRKGVSQFRVPAAAPAKPKRESRAAAVEQPIFDSLTTQEEVFSREATFAHTDEESEQEPARQDNAAMPRRTIAAIDYSSLLQPAGAPKPRSKVLMFAAAVVVILAFVAAGAMYLRRNTGRAAQVSSTTPVASQPAPDPAVVTPNPVATPPVATTSPAAPQLQVQPRASVPTPVSANEQNSISVEPTHASQKSAATTSHPIISTGMANIYAGDLKAHAQITPRASTHVTAPVPDVNVPAPKEIPEASAGNGLGSLVSGTGGSNLAKPDTVQGGNVQLPKLVSSVAPTYPQLATANHVEGDVKIQAEIDTSGRVTSTKVVSGPILLRSAAVNAVRQWRYSPAMLDGKAISTQYVVTVRFHLNQ